MSGEAPGVIPPPRDGVIRKQRIVALRDRYIEGLRGYLRKASPAQTTGALRLGWQAVAFGLETLELAQIHQSALDALKISEDQRDAIRQAECYFAEATTPIVALHGAACRNTRELHQLKRTLRERTSALDRAHRSLRRHVDRRQATEAALKANGRHCRSLLKESHLVRDRLRLLAHKGLISQERKRRSISHELQDDIAQALLGINIRLLHLRTKSGKDGQGLAGDLARTQQLVAESRRSMRRITRRIAIP